VTGEPGRNAGAEPLQVQLRRREELRLQRLDGADVQAQIHEVEAEIQQQRRELSLRDPQFARFVDASDLDLTDADSFSRRLELLGSRATLLGILLYGGSVWTYALWSDGAVVEHRTRETLIPADENEALPALSRGVLEPLAARLDALQPEDRVIMSVCDGLWTIPFAALPYRGRPLCDLVTLSFIQGIDVLEACLDRADRELDQLLCVGDPLRPDQDPLEGALAEARAIESAFRTAGKRGAILQGAAATVGAFRDALAECDVIHLACHADTSAEENGSFRLLLASDPATKDSGDLSEDRIRYEIQLHPGCMVNLAACATAEQPSSDSPLYGGLVSAFLLAGASSVVATLWPIADDTAALFQQIFYKHLLAGVRPAESLAATQRACIAGQFGDAMQSPMTWAAYVVWGRG
jgi:CHAT domain-containing protein